MTPNGPRRSPVGTMEAPNDVLLAQTPTMAGAAQNPPSTDDEQSLARLLALKEADALLRTRADASKVTVCKGTQIEVGIPRHAERGQHLDHQDSVDANLREILQQLHRQARQSAVSSNKL